MIKTNIQIRFSDADSLGHVNNVRVQEYFDLGKTDYFRQVLGMNASHRGVGVIIANVNTNFFAPTFLHEAVYVETQIIQVGTKSVVMKQRLMADERAVKAECQTTLVAYDFARNTSIEVLPEWRERMEEYEKF